MTATNNKFATFCALTLALGGSLEGFGWDSATEMMIFERDLEITEELDAEIAELDAEREEEDRWGVWCNDPRYLSDEELEAHHLALELEAQEMELSK